jgi:hypothetical protein
MKLSDTLKTLEEIFPIKNFFSGKYRTPVTLDEFRRFLRYQDKADLETIIDFYEDAKLYSEIYHEWRLYRRNLEKSIAHSTSNEASVSSGPEGMQRSSALGDSNFEIPNILSSDDHSSTHVSATDDSSSPSNSALDLLQSKGSQQQLTKSSNSRDNILITSSSSEHSLRQFMDSHRRVSSKQVSAMAIRLFRRYLFPGAPQYLHQIPRAILEPIIKHYSKTLETAKKTGLRFIPSPKRALVPVMHAVRSYLYRERLYGQFLDFVCANIIPSTTKDTYGYHSPALFNSYLQSLFCCVLVGCAMLIMIYLRAQRWWLMFLIFPIGFLLTSSLTTFNNISLYLWVRRRREMLSFEDGNDEERGGDLQPSPSSTTSVLRVKVVNINEKLVLDAQNTLVFRLALLSTAFSVAIVCLVVLFWPDFK